MGAEGGEGHEPCDAGSRRLLRERPRALHMNRLEAHARLLYVGGDGVHDGVGPGDGGGDRGRVAHVGAQDLDMVRIRKDVPRPLGRPDRDAHARPFTGEPPHEPPAEEARAAEYADGGQYFEAASSRST